jgi:hypothetical protein
MLVPIDGDEFDAGDAFLLEPLLHPGEETSADTAPPEGAGDVKLAHKAVGAALEERRLMVDGGETISDHAGMVLSHGQERSGVGELRAKMGFSRRDGVRGEPIPGVEVGMKLHEFAPQRDDRRDVSFDGSANEDALCGGGAHGGQGSGEIQPTHRARGTGEFAGFDAQALG